MKIKLSSKLIVMVLCAFILVGSAVLYAGPFTDIDDDCHSYCSKKYDRQYSLELYFACYNGCVFGADL